MARRRKAPPKHFGDWWFNQKDDPDALALAAKAEAQRLEDANVDRRATMLQWADIYEGVAGWTGASSVARRRRRYGAARGMNVVQVNVLGSAVDSLVAQITANPMKVKIVPNGGDFDLRRRCRSVNDFIFGMSDSMRSEEIFRTALLDGLVTGLGIGYVEGDDLSAHGMSCERVFAGDVYISGASEWASNPRSLHWRREMPLELAMARWPDASEALAYGESQESDYREDDAGVVTLWYSWHLPSTPDGDDGIYVVHCDGGHVDSGQYKHREYPFFFCRPAGRAHGWYGRSMVRDLSGMQSDINFCSSNISDGIRTFAGKTLVRRNAEINISALNDVMGAVVEVDDIHNDIVVKAFDPISPQLMQWNDRISQLMYQLPGVNLLQATGEKPAGLNSEPALQEYRDAGSQRQASVRDAFTEMGVGFTRCLLRVAAALVEEGKSVKTTVIRGGASVELDFESIMMEESKFKVQMAPGSGLPTSLAGKLQSLDSMLKLQMPISKEDIANALDLPDIQSLRSSLTAHADASDSIIDKILGDGESVELDDVLDMAVFIPRAKIAACRALFTDGVDKERVAVLLDTIQEAQAIQAAQMAAQQPVAVPGEQPPGEPMDLGAALGDGGGIAV